MAPAALWSRAGGAGHEARLARAAAAGDARAFAALFELHGSRVFNLAFRITGSQALAAEATRTAFRNALLALPHLEPDAARVELCLSIAARDASRALLEPSAGGTDPAATARPEPYEARTGHLGAETEQERLGAAGLGLAKPQREVLALGGAPYADLAAITGTGRAAVATLIAHARLGLHDELHGTGLAAAAAAAPEECGQALELIAMREDGVLDEGDADWLLGHLAHCGACRLGLDAMQAAAAAYDAWAPLPPPATLREETWSVAAPPRPQADTAQAPAPVTGVLARLAALRGRIPTGEALKGRLGAIPRPGLTAVLVILILFGVSSVGAGVALVVGDGDRPPERAAPAAAGAAPAPIPAARPAPARKRPRRRRVAPRPQTTTVPVVPQAVVTTPAPTPKPRKDKRKRRESPAKRTPKRTQPAEPAPPPEPAPAPPTTAPTPTTPPATVPPAPGPAGCTDAAGQPVPCPG